MNQCNCLEHREVISTLTAKVKRYEDLIQKARKALRNCVGQIESTRLERREALTEIEAALNNGGESK